MSNYKEIIELYKEIYNSTKGINTLLLNDRIDDIQLVINDREELIREVNSLKKKIVLSVDEKKEVENWILKIKEFNNYVTDKLIKKRDDLGQKIASLSRGKRALSAYKIEKEAISTIFDAQGV